MDTSTCAREGDGSASLCTVWTDPAPVENGFYYARVIEVPTCRWSQRECINFPADERPAGCTDSHIEQAVQQRAWSSPIWVGQ